MATTEMVGPVDTPYRTLLTQATCVFRNVNPMNWLLG